MITSPRIVAMLIMTAGLWTLTACATRTGDHQPRADAGYPDAGAPDGGGRWTIIQYGSDSHDEAFAVALDQQGDAYVAGVTDGVFEVEGDSTGRDVFLARATATEIAWVRQKGSELADDARDVTVTRDGTAYLVGTARGALPDATWLGGADLFVAAYGPTGDPMWTTQHGSVEADFGLGVALSPMGEVHVAGATAEDVERGFEISVDRASASTGFIDRSSRYGTSDGHDRGEGVAISAGGDVIIVGSTTASFAGPAAGSTDVFVLRLDSDLREKWRAQRGTPDIDGAFRVALDAEENAFVIAVSFADLLTGQEENDGIQNVFVIKVDPEGHHLWTVRLGSVEHYARAMGLTVGPDGTVYVAGFTMGDLGAPNRGGRDAFAAALSGRGDLLWAEQIGTTADDEARDVAVATGGELVVVGMTRGALEGEPAGGSDVFVARRYSP